MHLQLLPVRSRLTYNCYYHWRARSLRRKSSCPHHGSTVQKSKTCMGDMGNTVNGPCSSTPSIPSLSTSLESSMLLKNCQLKGPFACCKQSCIWCLRRPRIIFYGLQAQFPGSLLVLCFLGLECKLLLYREQVEEKTRANQKFCARPKKNTTALCSWITWITNHFAHSKCRFPCQAIGRFQFATQMLDLVRNVDHSKALCTAMVLYPSAKWCSHRVSSKLVRDVVEE